MVVDCIQHDLFFLLQTLIDCFPQRPGTIFSLIGKLMVVVLCVLIVWQSQAMNSVLGLQQMNQIVAVLKVDCVMTNTVQRNGLS